MAVVRMSALLKSTGPNAHWRTEMDDMYNTVLKNRRAIINSKSKTYADLDKDQRRALAEREHSVSKHKELNDKIWKIASILERKGNSLHDDLYGHESFTAGHAAATQADLDRKARIAAGEEEEPQKADPYDIGASTAQARSKGQDIVPDVGADSYEDEDTEDTGRADYDEEMGKSFEQPEKIFTPVSKRVTKKSQAEEAKKLANQNAVADAQAAAYEASQTSTKRGKADLAKSGAAIAEATGESVSREEVIEGESQAAADSDIGLFGVAKRSKAFEDAQKKAEATAAANLAKAKAESIPKTDEAVAADLSGQSRIEPEHKRVMGGILPIEHVLQYAGSIDETGLQIKIRNIKPEHVGQLLTSADHYYGSTDTLPQQRGRGSSVVRNRAGRITALPVGRNNDTTTAPTKRNVKSALQNLLAIHGGSERKTPCASDNCFGYTNGTDICGDCDEKARQGDLVVANTGSRRRSTTDIEGWTDTRAPSPVKSGTTAFEMEEKAKEDAVRLQHEEKEHNDALAYLKASVKAGNPDVLTNPDGSAHSLTKADGTPHNIASLTRAYQTVRNAKAAALFAHKSARFHQGKDLVDPELESLMAGGRKRKAKTKSTTVTTTEESTEEPLTRNAPALTPPDEPFFNPEDIAGLRKIGAATRTGELTTPIDPEEVRTGQARAGIAERALIGSSFDPNKRLIMQTGRGRLKIAPGPSYATDSDEPKERIYINPITGASRRVVNLSEYASRQTQAGKGALEETLKSLGNGSMSIAHRTVEQLASHVSAKYGIALHDDLFSHPEHQYDEEGNRVGSANDRR